MPKDYPTADLRRCHECGVLPGRDHHYDCTSWEARQIRRQWLREERQLEMEEGTEVEE